MHKSYWSLLFLAIFHMCIQCILMVSTHHYLDLFLPPIGPLPFSQPSSQESSFFLQWCGGQVFYNGLHVNKMEIPPSSSNCQPITPQGEVEPHEPIPPSLEPTPPVMQAISPVTERPRAQRNLPGFQLSASSIWLASQVLYRPLGESCYQQSSFEPCGRTTQPDKMLSLTQQWKVCCQGSQSPSDWA